MRCKVFGIAVALVACKGGGGTSSGSAPTATLDAAVVPAVAVDAAVLAPDAAAAQLDAAAVDVPSGAAATPTPAGVARLVLVRAAPLLRSEEKARKRVAAALARGKPKGAVVDAGADEAALLAAWTAAEPPEPMPALPAAWADAPVVVVIELSPPTGVEPKRQSGGVGVRAVFRPPAVEPVYVERGLTQSEYLDDLARPGGFLDVVGIAGGAP